MGYDVDSDFETDKITINGDFKPYFKIYVKGQLQEPISYEDVGISQDDLLRNVEQITGEKHLSPSFVPDDDFKINPSTVYPEKLGKKLEKIVAKRMEEAKKRLAFLCESACDILEEHGIKSEVLKEIALSINERVR